jgi:acyl-CoA reductase-like NAD-dependent aldehyde dehydrogenase
MDEYKRAKKTLEYRIAARHFETAFDACARLPQEERESLLKEAAARILQQLRAGALEEESGVRIVGIEIKQ